MYLLFRFGVKLESMPYRCNAGFAIQLPRPRAKLCGHEEVFGKKRRKKPEGIGTYELDKKDNPKGCPFSWERGTRGDKEPVPSVPVHNLSLSANC